jgi:hypothetical protein
MLLIGLLLFRMMPAHRPASGLKYGRVITTMVRLPRRMPELCWRSAYGALMFGSFNMFWTSAPLMLADRFHLGQHEIGMFALAGAGGALAAPWAGRLSDGGREIVATFGAMLVLAVSFLTSIWAAGAAVLPLLVVCAVLIDAAVQTSAVVSRLTVISTPPPTSMYRNTVGWFASGGLALPPLCVCTSVNAAAQLAGAGIGVGIFPLRMIEAYGPRIGIIPTVSQPASGLVCFAHHVSADRQHVGAVLAVLQAVVAELDYFGSSPRTA